MPADPARTPPAPPAQPAAATPPARRSETALVVWWLVCDLASIPFHLVGFLFARARHRRDFQRALKDAAT